MTEIENRMVSAVTEIEEGGGGWARLSVAEGGSWGGWRLTNWRRE